ncbi:C10 family peptidase [Porphyromonas gulae]|uniref:C10 family peptidase n=1 Tax=Porphyromonas gulae TaxID=111105 RepID=UPI0005804520|nr:C10 family peptidase [Porphyromonas gulae]
MKKFFLTGMALVLVLTACTKEAFEVQPNGTEQQQTEKRTFEDRVKAFASANYAEMIRGQGGSGESPEVESLEPITVTTDVRSGEQKKDTIAYIVNFQGRTNSMVIAGSKVLPPTTVAYSDDSRISINDTTKCAELACFIRLLPNYYYQELGQRIIDFGLATAEQVANFTSQELLQFENQLEELGDTPSPTHNIPFGSFKPDLTNFSVATTQQKKLLNVQWHQRFPFNYHAPLVPTPSGTLVNALAGCVAVAVGQITTCHQHPTVLNNQGLDWTILSKPTGDSFSSFEEITAIASYMRTIGDYCKNNWGYNGTSASGKNVPKAFDKLGYQTTNLIKYKESRVDESLGNNWPVYIQGQRASNAHAWVIDGYRHVKYKYYYYSPNGTLIGIGIKYENFFHCNWGWGGSYNGFFKKGVFDTDSGVRFIGRDGQVFEAPLNGRTHYTSRLKIVTNIRKK